MHDPELLGLVVLLGVLIVINAGIHWFVVCRTLYKRGAKFPTGLLFWRVFKELRAYREIRQAHGASMSVYYIAFLLSWFNLLLAFGTALRALWDQSNPY